MTTDTGNKHANRSAQTRERFIEAAQQLFAERSIDSVSLNEITVAAGQKNRNALQYHFGNRDGLLQAIIDQHANRVQDLRREQLESSSNSGDSSARCAARALVLPLAQHIEEDSTAVYYVKILSQLAALNSDVINPATRSGITLSDDKQLRGILAQATAHLQPAEAQRRLFLMISITFHGIADACRASEADDSTPVLMQRAPMITQVALAVEALLSAPALE